MEAESQVDPQKVEEDSTDRKRGRESIRNETEVDDTVSGTNPSPDKHKKKETIKKKKKHPINAEVVVNPCCIIPFQSLRAEVEKFLRASFEPSFMVSTSSQKCACNVL